MKEIPTSELPDHLKLHYTQLPPAVRSGGISREYETYRRIVGQLIADGHEGKHILIKGEEVIGLYQTDGEAMDEGYKRFLGQAFYVHQIQTWERIYRPGCVQPCPT